MWEAFFVCTGVRFGGFFAETSPCALAGAQPSTGRLGWTCDKTAVCRELFLLQKVPQSVQEKILLPILQFTRKGASNDKVFRTLRRATKGFAFGNHSLLKKAGENFILQKLGAAR